jgi:hypothetical protein
LDKTSAVNVEGSLRCMASGQSTLLAQEMEEVDVIINYGKYHLFHGWVIDQQFVASSELPSICNKS